MLAVAGTHDDRCTGSPMSTIERIGEIQPSAMTEQELEMVRAAERNIMAALDHSREASITLPEGEGSQSAIQVPPQGELTQWLAVAFRQMHASTHVRKTHHDLIAIGPVASRSPRR